MMEAAIYTIDTEADRRLLVLRLRGFWNDATMDRYSEALGSALRSIRHRPSQVGMLIDALHLPVQSQVIAKRHEAFFLEFAGKIDHVALLVDSQLIRLQSGRLASAGSYTMFNAEADARAWLAEMLCLPAIAEAPERPASGSARP